MKYTFEVEDGGTVDTFIRQLLSYGKEEVEKEAILAIDMGVSVALEGKEEDESEVQTLVKSFACQVAFLRIVQAIRDQRKKQAELN
jgi:hypothetical protein